MLKRILRLLLFASLIAPADWRQTAPPFAGDWKLDPSRSEMTDAMTAESLGAPQLAHNPPIPRFLRGEGGMVKTQIIGTRSGVH